MNLPDFHINKKWILDQRGPKNKVDRRQPYAWLVEKERQPNGEIADVATVFLTNRECPFHCLMCDLWQNTTDTTVEAPDIVRQLEFALEKLPPVKHIKLYNSGNFFDPKAIPPAAYDGMIALLHGFESILVENHPRLTSQKIVDFRNRLDADLQVAMGLETVHPQVLPLLQKEMTLDDFAKATKYLKIHGISARAFILLRPPFMDEAEGVRWVKRSIDFAFDAGVECCSIIPTRSGNGVLNMLKIHEYFHEPNIRSLEEVLAYGIGCQQGRVFADLWDLEHFSGCDTCFNQRKERLDKMNLEQQKYPEIPCHCQS